MLGDQGREVDDVEQEKCVGCWEKPDIRAAAICAAAKKNEREHGQDDSSQGEEGLQTSV